MFAFHFFYDSYESKKTFNMKLVINYTNDSNTHVCKQEKTYCHHKVIPITTKKEINNFL